MVISDAFVSWLSHRSTDTTMHSKATDYFSEMHQKRASLFPRLIKTLSGLVTGKTKKFEVLPHLLSHDQHFFTADQNDFHRSAVNKKQNNQQTPKK